jgi:hypothetical protein
MPLPRGSIIMTDGNGKVTAVPISSDPVNTTLIFDPNDPYVLKWCPSSFFLTPTKQFLTINLSDTNKYNSPSYVPVVTFTMLGTSSVQINHIAVISSMDSALTSYDVRIYDTTNDQIIIEKNFDNTKTQMNVLESLSNLPKEDSVCEVQIRVNSKFLGNALKTKFAYNNELKIEYVPI